MSRVANTDTWSVYVITCSVTKMQYVGITGRTIWHRFGRHFDEAYSLGLKYPIAEAIREYGQTAFTIELVCVCSTLDEAHQHEIALIEQLNTLTPRGYNQTRGGHGRLGMKMSRSYRVAQSARMKVVASNPEWRRDVSQRLRNHWASLSPNARRARQSRSWRARRGAQDTRQLHLPTLKEH